ncbi:MAG: TIGR04282 family arsenosugar biosynthesis glycosyltransferase [Bryobacterales bacterium]|nr:TIGR04282 family arsenosugar biosynthesis glycosyltransferase [Bryobacterales bacterium]
MKPLIAVFAKAPEPGKVKTRLVPPLTPQSAADLHERLVRDVWRRVSSLCDVDCELHLDSETPAWPEASERRLQTCGDLGARMLSAFDHALGEGRPSVTIVGGDIPELPLPAVTALIEAPADVAFGPTRDGGYYAISCRKTHPAMFHLVRWSTSHALTDTVAACLKGGLAYWIGQPWHDVDTEEDLDLLPPELRP